MKKGFTIVELLAVLAIIAALTLITMVTYTGLKNDSENTIDNAVKIMISENSIKYVKNNKSNIKSGNTYCITLKDILDKNLMSAPVKNGNGEEISESTKIKISIVNDNYEVDVDVKTCEEVIVTN